MTRTSTLTASLPPTRRTSPSWRARRSFACIAGDMSPTSSMKSVPPCARWKRPSRVSVAPVKAPFSWPKSSASRRPSASAAQFSLTNGPARRAESSWMARAASSFPVPVSPRTSTGRSLPATFSSRARTRFMVSLAPRRPSVAALLARACAASEISVWPAPSVAEIGGVIPSLLVRGGRTLGVPNHAKARKSRTALALSCCRPCPSLFNAFSKRAGAAPKSESAPLLGGVLGGELVEDRDEVRLELARGLVALVRRLRHRLLDDRLDLLRDRRVEHPDRGRHLVQDLENEAARRLLVEGALAGEHVVERRAERVDVRALVRHERVVELLGRHVGERPHALARSRQARLAGRREALG